MHCHVLETTIEVSCGNGNQRLKWLGNVAISRYDQEDFQGWKVLGVAKSIKNGEGTELELGATIKDVLSDGDEVTVVPSVSLDKTTA